MPGFVGGLGECRPTPARPPRYPQTPPTYPVPRLRGTPADLRRSSDSSASRRRGSWKPGLRCRHLDAGLRDTCVSCEYDNAFISVEDFPNLAMKLLPDPAKLLGKRRGGHFCVARPMRVCAEPRSLAPLLVRRGRRRGPVRGRFWRGAQVTRCPGSPVTPRRPRSPARLGAPSRLR